LDSLELSKILSVGSICSVYQPIVSLQNGVVIGYEALSRGPVDSSLHFPDRLFQAATLADKTPELESLCRRKTLQNAMDLPSSMLLFINIHPDIFCDATLNEELCPDFLATCNLDTHRIVFEITEKGIIKDFDKLKTALAYYNNMGHSIAIDDMGSGYCGLNFLSKVHPHFIKIDMELIRDIDSEHFNQSIIECLVTLCKLNNIKMIAEGIETKEELITLIKLGVDMGQGYFLGRPSPDFEDIGSETKQTIISYYNQKVLRSTLCTYNHIGEIVQLSPSFLANTKCYAVKEYFDTHDELGCCIEHLEKPVGLVMKHTLDANLATLYGVSVFMNRSISLVMDTHPIVVDYATSILDISKMAMNRPIPKIYDYIIVTRDDLYYGVVTVKSLLEYTTMIECNFARELNPLTALPGNRTIQSKLMACISSGKPCCVLYLDLDHFKVYNDIYGFENGDLILKYTAEVITSLVKSYCGYSEFTGHIGGDDFVCILEKPYEVCKLLCEKMIQTFDEGIINFFNLTDRAHGYIAGVNRQGDTAHFPLTCLSIAGVYGSLDKLQTLENVGVYMASLKKKAKEIASSSYIMEILK